MFSDPNFLRKKENLVKKIISLFLAIVLVATMSSSLTIQSFAADDSNVTQYDIVKTECTDPDNLFGAASNISLSMSGNKISTGSYTGYNLSQNNWKMYRPTFLFLTEENGVKSKLMTKQGAKYIVEMEYVVTSDRTDSHSLQVGLLGNIGANGMTESSTWLDTDENGTKLYNTHPAADNGKTIRYTVVFTAASVHNVGLVFYGKGSIALNNIKVIELTAQEIDNYSVVKFVHGDNESTEFVKTNSAPKTLEINNGAFVGWYAASDFSGDSVTTITEDTTLYAKCIETATYNIVKTESTTPDNLVGAATGISISMSGSKISTGSYNGYNLSANGWKSYRPTFFFLTEKDGVKSKFMTKAGAKYIAEIEYVVTSNRTDSHSLQVGLLGNLKEQGQSEDATWLDTDANGTKLYKTHPAADNGKTICYTVVFTAASAHNVGLVFYGQGAITLNSIKVSELPADGIDNFAVVDFVENGKTSTEFVIKNSAPKTLSKVGCEFGGWYASSDCSGNPVTTITEDTTLYAKWIKPATYDIVKTESTTPDNLVGAATGISISMSGSKISTGSYNGYNLSVNGWKSYRPTFFFLTEKDGVKSKFMTKAGAKYIAEIEYVVTSNRTDSHSLQVGLLGNLKEQGQSEDATWLDTDANGTKLYKTHPAADNGKTICYTVVFTAASAHNVGLVFYGQGAITLNSIRVSELPAGLINDYVQVAYDDNGVVSTEFVLKNTNLNTPSKANYKFMGWYNSDNTKITVATEDMTVKAAWLGDGNVDLTKSVKIEGDKATLVPTIPTDASTPLDVSVQGFSHILINNETDEMLTNTWAAGALIALKYSDDSYVGLKSDTKYVVNVEYDITKIGTSDKDFYPQIAIVYNDNPAASNVLSDNGTIIKAVKKHSETLTGATISCVVSGVNSNALRLAFDGQGTFAIKSVTVTEMIGNVEMNVVTFKDATTSTNKIIVAENGAAVADLPRTLHYNFGGWYNGDEKVTAVSDDATLTAKWFDRADVTLNGTIDVIDIVRIKKALADENTDLIYDIDRDNNVLATDATVLRKTLLGVDTLLIAGNDISTYSVNAGAQASFMTARATDSLVETLEGYSKNSTKASSDKKIVVGISNIDDSILKTAALENLTGINGDVYGLNDYKIFLKDDNIYIEAGSDYATAFAVNKFVDFIKKNKIIPAGFVLSGTYNNEKDVLDGYSYVWGDEFNADVLNTGKWWITSENANEAGPLYSKTNSYYLSSRFGGNYGGPWIDPDGNPNMQEGVIERPNVEGEDYYLNDGLLVLNTRKTDKGYTAVRLNGTHQFKYGIMTARVKLATKNGACSTLWARSNDDDKGSSVNEFDFVENFGTESIYPNLHTWNNYSEDTNHKNDIKDCSQTLTPAEGESFSDSFHDIALYWTSEKIVFYFDGVAYLDLDITADPEKWAAFHKTTHMVMGVSAPSGYYAMNYGAKAPGDYLGELINSFSENFSLDYVRVFQK